MFTIPACDFATLRIYATEDATIYGKVTAITKFRVSVVCDIEGHEPHIIFLYENDNIWRCALNVCESNYDTSKYFLELYYDSEFVNIIQYYFHYTKDITVYGKWVKLLDFML